MDLIDRDKLKAAYLEEHVGKPGRAYELICEAETVNAEPVRHGQWTGKTQIKRCSICGNYLDFRKLNAGRMGGNYFYYRYCPNCGAKMDWEV